MELNEHVFILIRRIKLIIVERVVITPVVGDIEA